MSVSSVSFGKVIAVSGKSKKVRYLRNEMSKTPNVSVLDATDHYMSTITGGLLHKAAKRYDMIDIYITGEDYKSLKNQEEGWRDLNDILSHIDKYFNLRTTSTNTVKEVLKQNS